MGTGGRTPDDVKLTAKHLIVKGRDVGDDGWLHPGVDIDADHLPAPSAKDSPERASATEEFQESGHYLNVEDSCEQEVDG